MYYFDLVILLKWVHTYFGDFPKQPVKIILVVILIKVEYPMYNLTSVNN